MFQQRLLAPGVASQGRAGGRSTWFWRGFPGRDLLRPANYLAAFSAATAGSKSRTCGECRSKSLSLGITLEFCPFWGRVGAYLGLRNPSCSCGPRRRGGLAESGQLRPLRSVGEARSQLTQNQRVCGPRSDYSSWRPLSRHASALWSRLLQHPRETARLPRRLAGHARVVTMPSLRRGLHG